MKNVRKCFGTCERLYSERESNPHSVYGNRILSPACLPVPPSEQAVNLLKIKPFFLTGRALSERRDSNSRPRPWQGRALPTELLSRWECKYIQKSIFCKIKNKFDTFDSLNLIAHQPYAVIKLPAMNGAHA
jgi:hypothetical protein